MSVPDVLPVVDAVRAALTTVGLTVYVGGAPDKAGPMYAVLYPDPGTAVRQSLADDRGGLDSLMQITCVGTTVERALWVAARARSGLAAPLVVAGRSCWLPEDLGGPPVQRDDDVTPPLFFVPVQYRLMSVPQ
ncbi:hypothetical protein [Streptomyces sp. SCSIO ZS0520]|uniref:hypothetical protein n=1 Tax=Streptomyces sp. SCSIO ZS0520 TaxID=2892996 RepID=UPI0021DA2DA3|nr:hypothetical protein [Streptomyces sp. SCSIO ZS0520]